MQDFLLLPQGFESFPSDLLQTRWPNLVHVEYLQMGKPVVVGFVALGVDATLGNGCRI